MIDEERLQELLDVATVDCYDEEEEFMGVLITVDENDEISAEWLAMSCWWANNFTSGYDE